MTTEEHICRTCIHYEWFPEPNVGECTSVLGLSDEERKENAKNPNFTSEKFPTETCEDWA